MDSAAWGLLGTIVGALASMGTAWLTARSSSRRELDRARDERIERANAFQRQTLVDLQDAIHDALRLAAQAHMEDWPAHREGRDWDRNMLSEGVNEGNRLAQRKVSILIERVSDDALRSKVKALMSTSMQLVQARSEEESNIILQRMAAESGPVLEAIGVILRNHY